jgi:hypothetical protein
MNDQRTPEEFANTKRITTRDGIVVRVGQRWRNCDKRTNGQIKTVTAVDVRNGKAQLAWNGFFKSWNSIRRMYRHATGWELVE